MSKEKQIEEMAKVMANGRFVEPNNNQIRIFIGEAESLYNAGYRKQSEGEWITVGEELKNTTCSVCGHWVETPYGKTPFCPDCGAHMRKEDEGK